MMASIVVFTLASALAAHGASMPFLVLAAACREHQGRHARGAPPLLSLSRTIFPIPMCACAGR
ncbi:hypothetical protein ACU4GD_36905 [Cupriavidus basilensis]